MSTALKVVQSQAETALREAMANFVLVAIGENLARHTSIKCVDTGRPMEGVTIWQVTATVEYPATGRTIRCEALMPVAAPDESDGNYRIADWFFSITVDDYLEGFRFYAWCESNPGLGEMIIVHAAPKESGQGLDRWLIGGGMDDEVIYRGSFEGAPFWAKTIAFYGHSEKM